MKNDPLDPLVRELSWRRKIGPEAQARLRAWLAVHPEAQGDWEGEAELTEALNELPNVPVASNFTARVLQTVERENQPHRNEPVRSFWRWRWLPRIAVAALVLGGGFHLFEQQRQRHELANSLVAVSEAAPLDPQVFPQVLEDFDTIRALNQTSADQQLLSLLQEKP